MNLVRAFFFKIRVLFFKFWKRAGETSPPPFPPPFPPPPSSYAPVFMVALLTTVLKSQNKTLKFNNKDIRNLINLPFRLGSYLELLLKKDLKNTRHCHQTLKLTLKVKIANYTQEYGTLSGHGIPLYQRNMGIYRVLFAYLRM